MKQRQRKFQSLTLYLDNLIEFLQLGKASSLTGRNIYCNSVTSQVTCSCRLKFGTEYIEFRITDSVRSSWSNKDNNFGSITVTVILHTCACLKR